MKWIVVIAYFITLCGCSLAPKYHPPAVMVTPDYKENGIWLLANPNLASLDRGPWWQMYCDPELDMLEAQVSCGNQNLKAALARYDEARAAVTIVRAALFPSVNGIGNGNRVKTSSTIADPAPVPLFNDALVGASFTYELDVWGRVRNSVAAAKNLACASAADLAAVDLSLHAELANDYFSLRGADKAQRVLDNTVIMYQKALTIIRHRYHEGTVSDYDVQLAENQVETAKTLAANNHLIRGQFEHAIAILIGQPPATFSVCPLNTWKVPLVTIVPELPSCLLERRPDITEAEQLVQAANANIGVARAAFFPQINLAAGIGFESASLGQLFKVPSLIWSLGQAAISELSGASSPLVTQIIFDGGLNMGITNQAEAKYFETVANYRQTVLTAFREVEDSLLAIRQLDRENHTQTLATKEAQRALQQANYRYAGGIITYLDIVVVQNLALQSELSVINIQTQRQISSVQLIKALGGGWSQCGS